MNELTFYRCSLCGNIICMIRDSGAIPSCCGEEMEAVTPNTTDARIEKHIPVIQRDGSKVLVCVGNTPHPMTEDHHIEWVILQTSQGAYARRLQPSAIPEVCFRISADEEPLRAWAWCNLHGLWLRSMAG